MAALSLPAVVLAGGSEPEAVARYLGLPHKALAVVGGKPALVWVIEALLAAERIGPVVVSTQLDAVAQIVPEGVGVAWAGGSGFLDTLAAGFAYFADADKVLLATGDLPLLSPAAVDDFARRALDSGAELCYSTVEEKRLSALPGQPSRLLIRLREGRYAGGNLVVMSRRFFQQEAPRVHLAFAGRKSGLALARLLGLRFIWGLFRGNLSIADIVAKAERILRVPCLAVDSQYPEIAFDLDKPEHIAMAEEALAQHAAAQRREP